MLTFDTAILGKRQNDDADDNDRPSKQQRAEPLLFAPMPASILQKVEDLVRCEATQEKEQRDRQREEHLSRRLEEQKHTRDEIVAEINQRHEEEVARLTSQNSDLTQELVKLQDQVVVEAARPTERRYIIKYMNDLGRLNQELAQDVANASAETIVRDALEAAANAAGLQVEQYHADVIQGLKQNVSSLQSQLAFAKTQASRATRDRRVVGRDRRLQHQPQQSRLEPDLGPQWRLAEELRISKLDLVTAKQTSDEYETSFNNAEEERRRIAEKYYRQTKDLEDLEKGYKDLETAHKHLKEAAKRKQRYIDNVKAPDQEEVNRLPTLEALIGQPVEDILDAYRDLLAEFVRLSKIILHSDERYKEEMSETRELLEKTLTENKRLQNQLAYLGQQSQTNIATLKAREAELNARDDKDADGALACLERFNMNT